jgi:acetate kinase
MKILVLNSGSSSQKCCLYEASQPLSIAPPSRLWDGKVDWTDDSRATITVRSGATKTLDETIQLPSRSEGVDRLLRTLWESDHRVLSHRDEVECVGHRVVHGGLHHLEPEAVTPAVRESIAGVSAFAPLHNRAELEGMDVVASLFGDTPQVAVFDTGFHRHMPLAAKVYAGPYEWYEQGIHRFGFHGINHEYCRDRVSEMLGRDPNSLRIVNCHIGNGCSLAAIQNGKSVDTTMGFTPLEGLAMGTRSGSVDPGILTYLMRSQKLSGETMDALLNRQSGLLGLSGVSGDVREIRQAIDAGNARAQIAWDVYVHRLISSIGSMIAAMGGIDALSFTAGVGENSAELRSEVCEQLGFLGLVLDQQKNTGSRPDAILSAPQSSIVVLVVGAQEEWQIARACYRLRTVSPG